MFKSEKQYKTHYNDHEIGCKIQHVYHLLMQDVEKTKKYMNEELLFHFRLLAPEEFEKVKEIMQNQLEKEVVLFEEFYEMFKLILHRE